MTDPAVPVSVPGWICSYSNEGFDMAQSLAYRLTDMDRAAGRPAPPFGYSRERFREAEAAVREADLYGAAKQGSGLLEGK